MIGNRLLLFHELDSTNNYAAKLLAEGKLTHGTVILAENQTAGKGQRGNTWLSTGLKQFTGSYYIETAFLSVEKLIYFNIAVSLAVKDAIQKVTSSKIDIKWPNDLLIDNKKVAGILIETQFRSGVLAGAIVGIGINLTAESELSSSCCVSEFAGYQVEPLSMLEVLSEQLTFSIQRLKNGEYGQLLADYYASLWKFNTQITAQTSTGELIEGKIIGIDETGNLQFQNEQGIHVFGVQKIKFNY